MRLTKIATIVLMASSIAVVACGDDEPNNTTSPSGTGASGNAGGTGGSGATGGAGGSGGMAAMPRGPMNPPTLGSQIDRMGRAAINTALNHAFDGDDNTKGAAKDAYNAAAPADWSTFAGEIQANLAILDSLDTNCGNQLIADLDPNDRYGALAGILADDQLYVNSEEGECGVYLGLEAEVAGAVNAGDGKCGGRTPSDDVIERSYSVLAAGALAGVDDTITADDATVSDTFPFLAAPN